MKSSLLILIVLFLFSSVMMAQQNSSDAPQDGETYYKTREVDKTVIIKSKPRAETNQTCTENSLRISIRVYFHRSGQISLVKLITPSSCEYFNENSVDVAYRIKFLPAIKNGQAVSYTTIVQTNSTKY